MPTPELSAPGTAVLIGIALLLATLPPLMVYLLYAVWGRPLRRGAGRGEHVAEVWLEWEICRGSTMYRERFATAAQAERGARRAARLLDLMLPKRYRAEFSNGAPYWETYGFEIHWGVRQATPQERENFHPVWTTHLPGTRDHAGEHATAHPVFGDIRLQGELAGFKL